MKYGINSILLDRSISITFALFTLMLEDNVLNQSKFQPYIRRMEKYVLFTNVNLRDNIASLVQTALTLKKLALLSFVLDACFFAFQILL